MNRWIGLALLMMLGVAARADDLPVVQVYKSPTCGCCEAWIDHLEANGFEVQSTNVPDVAKYKKANDLPPFLSSCHTALVDGYVVEGHVPAEDIVRMLKERPDIAGIAVPRMPIGSPGMEGPNAQAYKVMSFTEDGKIEEYASHLP